jgi:uncharacterized protein (DUF1499 family)
LTLPGRATRALALAWLLGCAGCAAPTPENLGVHEGRLAPCPSSPNCVSTAGDDAHRTDPFVLAMPPERAWPLVPDAVTSLPGTRIVEADGGYLHAECTTPLMRFVDDLELLLLADEGRIAVRSASRTGWSDLGANRERVWQLRRALHQRGVIR